MLRAMSSQAVKPFGEWASPISTALMTASSISISNLAVDGNTALWTEGRPMEKGRYVVVQHTADGKQSDVTPAGFNARTRVHEYGGGQSLTVGGVSYFSNFDDQRLYKARAGDESATPLTEDGPFRYADACLDEKRNRLICVVEDHTIDEPSKVVNTVCAVDVASGARTVLAQGQDFYSSPRVSPDGTKLCFVSWQHPNLPWDDTTLTVADIAADGSLCNEKIVAGGDGKDEAVTYPSWSRDGELFFISDRSGFWNLFKSVDGQVSSVFALDTDIAGCAWVFGLNPYAFLPDGRVLLTHSQGGKAQLVLVDGKDPSKTSTVPASAVPHSVDSVRVAENGVVFMLGGSPSQPRQVTALDTDALAGRSAPRVLKSSFGASVDELSAFIAVPEQIEFPTTGDKTAFGFYYKPTNKDFKAPDSEQPPMLVKVHGGPTSCASTVFRLDIQYWTSRGFAVCDVNYGGSSGFGRAYRKRLAGTWGIVDVDDVCAAANYLVAQGNADAKRLCIDGGSAGGYTTLAALTRRQTFSAGCSKYGVSDLGVLASDTHKFESRYLDGLIGAYPQQKAIYEERSPLNHTDGLNCPILILQGDEDKIVPPNQAELFYDAALKKKIPTALVMFEGEQHGFRKAENIRRALDLELFFFGRVFGFVPDDEIEPVEIHNLVKKN